MTTSPVLTAQQWQMCTLTLFHVTPVCDLQSYMQNATVTLESVTCQYYHVF